LSAAASPGAAVRALAAKLNARVVDAGESLTVVEAQRTGLPERDQPLLMAMLQDSLRWHHRHEWLLGQLLERPLKRRDRLLAALLRIGLTQLAMLRIPDHAAVSATVEATAVLGLTRARGLVNAVLRRFLRERDALESAFSEDRSARFSYPEWLIAAIAQDWPGDWQRVLEAGNVHPPMWLRVNCRRSARQTYLGLLEAAGLQALPAADCADALLLAEPCPVAVLPGFEQGLVSVQDAGAQRVVELLQLEPGLRVLDACAAPGGKTAHLLERCPGLGAVVAVERDAERLAQVARTLARLGLSATLIAGDAARPGDWHSGAGFDRVLIDAPCSATGVIRRHPDIKLLRRPADIAGYTAVQAGLLDALWPLLVPGGRLVYVTCSVLRAENQAVTTAFASRTPDAALAAWGSPEHCQRLPGEANTDGFYYACLNKVRVSG
jgi:16S rRNA (cytosine967-C5)-methyltransferase